jgi:magnesium Mg(2+) and cobalt Co(2+) transport protein (corA)
MLNAFVIRDSRLQQIPVDDAKGLTEEVVWVDLVAPSNAERDWILRRYGQLLPEIEELVEIEASARFTQDEDGLHLRSYFLHDGEYVSNITVAFTLNKGRLFTLHEEDLPEFRMYRLRARAEAGIAKDAPAIFLGILDTKVEVLADTLEKLQAELETQGRLIYTKGERDITGIFADLSRNEDANGKVRLGLLDSQRALSYLQRCGILGHDVHTEMLHEIQRDIESLLTHSTFLFERVHLLMTSAMGIVNIQQNQIIKLFSVAAVILMPPTLVASIYGMNFRHMPELDWPWGYPLALLVMVASAILPYLYFQGKKWL